MELVDEEFFKSNRENMLVILSMFHGHFHDLHDDLGRVKHTIAQSALMKEIQIVRELMLKAMAAYEIIGTNVREDLAAWEKEHPREGSTCTCGKSGLV